MKVIKHSERLTFLVCQETLAHEMIHAYCFVFNLEKSRDGHGEVFRKFMTTINEATGTPTRPTALACPHFQA